ncbi:MAG: GNAT family N-acetyltransferase [Chloroflexi bacterium]|nr:GNAT family N-acetyltransferase [Chloroflexota bacterium]
MFLETQVTHRLEESSPDEWDALSRGRPFSSHNWYVFGERVMADCHPTIITVYKCGTAVARATFWLVRNEPLPLPSPLRRIFSAYLHYRPLFICRSPLAYAPGMALPEPPLQAPAIEAIIGVARDEVKRQGGSFLVFDFIPAGLVPCWPQGFTCYSFPNPGTVMELQWDSFEAYLASRNGRKRYHYNRTLREAEKLELRLERLEHVPDLDLAVDLVRRVEARHRTAANPWLRGMLGNIDLVEGTWLEASIGKRLAGCGLVMYDRDSQLLGPVGIDEKSPVIYSRLLYASLQDAFRPGIHTLHWGSGAYEFKRRLGFRLETNDQVHFQAIGRLPRTLARLIG